MDIEEIRKVYKDLITEVPQEDIFTEEFMYKHTTFKIGGVADVLIKVHSVPEMIHAIKIAKKYKQPIGVMGNGSNILVRDKGVRGILLKIELDTCEVIKDKDCAYVVSGAGLLLSKLSQILLAESLTGMEFAYGIPGTVGGAVAMNAGAFEQEFKDLVVETTYLDIDDEQIKTISKDEHKFSYRHSIFQDQNAVILSTKLKLQYGDKAEIEKKMEDNLAFRVAKQPTNMPSAGSTFKRGEDFIAAQIIDECSLKGKAVGGAQVSTKHAGFIINTGDARASEVMGLVELVQKRVLDETGKKLELEIKVIGE